MHLSLDVWLTQSLLAAVSPGAQDSDPALPVASLGLRCGSGLAGHLVVLRVDLSEGLTGVATSQSCSHCVSVVLCSLAASFFAFYCVLLLSIIAIVILTSKYMGASISLRFTPL